MRHTFFCVVSRACLESNSLNNFSISTDGLASALQRSASALKTAGNDIDESIGLITAGNQVVQDPESVGAAMRVISLRLTGTSQAKQELSELNEDTDGVITTVSKLRETIMNATKVASNGYKGVDLFDKNGNYRSTASVLQDIADIYSEIEETDKKTKSNNINLLLETISGKNRANTVASILQSPDILREAIESSKNAKGSADRENETYLSSLEAHITQLQTQLQELATVTINSDMFKGVIDTATAFLNIVTQILDKLPLLSTAIGGFAGFKLSQAGLGKQLNINHKASFNSKFYRS
nr:MAG TPA: minor tail protein [Caudoviricetes sp.]